MSYDVCISAANNSGKGPVSALAKAAPGEPSSTQVLTAPTGLSASPGWNKGLDGHSIRLTWRAVTNATVYEVQRSPDGTVWEAIGRVTNNAYVDTALTDGSTYHYKVRAIRVVSPTVYQTGDYSPARNKKTLPLFEVEVNIVEREGQTWTAESLDDFKWNVFLPAKAVVEVTTSRGADPKNYKFRLELPSRTGIQGSSTTTNRAGKCHWPRVTSPWRWPNADWPAQTTPWHTAGTHFPLVRCSKGAGASGSNPPKARVWARESIATAQERPTGYAEVIGRSWHRPDTSVTYTFGGTIKPADADYKRSIRAGANMWNSSGANISFTYVAANKSPDVTIDVYQEVGGRNLCNNTAKIACTIFYSSSRADISDVYPRRTHNVPLYFETDPDTPSKTLTWVYSEADVNVSRNKTYLGATIAHEFGHVAGLGHSANGDDVMGSGLFLRKLSDDDEKAMKSIYPPKPWDDGGHD